MNPIDEKNLAKLKALNNQHVLDIVEKYVKLCRPKKVTVITDDPKDIDYVRKKAVNRGEESPLSMNGHTVHFDGFHDQARDKEKTKILLKPGQTLNPRLNSGPREECLEEIFGFLDGIMDGKEVFVRFFCLGPINSKFSICALQLTDSAYVAHSEDMLYRPGYEQFKKLNGSDDFFHFIHSAGELAENNTSKNIDKRRVYIDLEKYRVISTNTQYAGNTVGLKKLALRLGIKKSDNEGWLCEHMLIMGAKPEGKNRITYFTGAFPSACGKTSTAMIPGQTIVGDDIAYLRAGEDGICYAANVESGIFGIIENVNPVDDPVIYSALTTPREIIFSNVLIKDGYPFWLGMGKDIPVAGYNFSGEWKHGKTVNGTEVLAAHKNARYTIRLAELENVDPKLEDPEGVPVSGVIYGGRDSDTNPPVLEAFSWSHGVFIGAALESETTAATLGQMGVRKHNPMANLDFLVIPLGKYIRNHLGFAEKLDKVPKVFSTNYFLKENGRFLTDKVDKKVWLMWMEGRVHNEYDAIETPIGFIPKYEDIKELFRQIFDRDFSEELYEKLFSIRIKKCLERLDRIEAIFRDEGDVPDDFFSHIYSERERLKEAAKKFGKDVIPPDKFI